MGGLCFLLRGNMCGGVVNDDLVVRAGSEGYEEALTQPHTRPMDFTGRPLKGFVFGAPGGHKRDRALATWTRHAIQLASSLPEK